MEIVGARPRHQANNGIGKIPVRIDQADSPVGQKVGDDHVLDHRRLTHTGLSDHIQMPPPVLQTQHDRPPIIPEQNPPQQHRSLFFFRGIRRKGAF